MLGPVVGMRLTHRKRPEAEHYKSVTILRAGSPP